MAQKQHYPVILIANHLLNGRILAWGKNGFTADLSSPLRAQNETEASALAAHGIAAFIAREVVDNELIPVKEKENGTFEALHLRERIKLKGPTIVYKEEAHV